MTAGSTWKTDPRGPFIRCHSGIKFYLSDPRPSEILVSDLAYHMARINRYTGASEISVAQHCAVGSILILEADPDNVALAKKFLIHDTAEAYIGDVSAPLKSLLPGYKELEAKVETVLEEFFGLKFRNDPAVKEVDDRMWLAEHLEVFPHARLEEVYRGPLVPITRGLKPDMVVGWPRLPAFSPGNIFNKLGPAVATDLWLNMYAKLFVNAA